MSKFFFDFHIHPTIKPFGRTAGHLLRKGIPVSKEGLEYGFLEKKWPRLFKRLFQHRSNYSIWREDNPNPILNPRFAELAFAKYSQSNFTAAADGHSKVLCVSLYPIEKEFLSKTLDQRLTGCPILKKMVTGIGSRRIKYIQSDDYNYFQDLEGEYEYLKTLSMQSADNGRKYTIVSDYSQLEQLLEEEPNTLAIVITIEGANVLYPSSQICQADMPVVLENIDRLKAWEHPPFLITLAHHFYNGLVSHEKSLVDFVTKLGKMDQSVGRNQKLSEIEGFNYFTEDGLQVINRLLSEQNGPRILIDVKHIDYRGRQEYYQYIEREFQNAVPVVVSHGAVGVQVDERWFNEWSLNLKNEDIEAVWKTKGLIGVELDQRILGFNELKAYKKRMGLPVRKLGAAFNSELVWNSIRYIAERCAFHINREPGCGHADPWAGICIGSDYDGLINPINQFPTLETFPLLEKHLLNHIERWYHEAPTLLHDLTIDSPQQLVERILFGNGMQFLKNNLKLE